MFHRLVSRGFSRNAGCYGHRLYSATTSASQPKGTGAKALGAVALTAGLAGAGITMYATTNDTLLPKHSALKDFDSLTLNQEEETHVISLEQQRENLDIVKRLRESPEHTCVEFNSTKPKTISTTSLTRYTLKGKDKLALDPVIFRNDKENSLVIVTHLGKALCGHKGIIHGGLLATLLDEGLAATVFPSMPGKNGVTANLNINYRKPVLADQFVSINARVTKVEGRKGWVEAQVKDMKGNVLVEASALFIAPKYFS
ncbi:Thioesterase/thiol ester dehydrase-isomerase [Basidiobolus meristosporus CBS 931.73]|uniref:Thioesterase/thiol ester dehydrase-isomerase n=1 Tax=Basidiobolus meristosporus CBS 931.73 TaxID=1314790 RepID=A0A1Y1YBA9_9FUNG|nr:Thioesterase/thiol ester dehydrase-isomerase [Basidiobolus meristosporus CBS 931.73]|eukprot:ORX95267.1 Thioesterase/thiol ester dehydrase-isomerase [Basidiobolus meristosporus CBS 931.73]